MRYGGKSWSTNICELLPLFVHERTILIFFAFQANEKRMDAVTYIVLYELDYTWGTVYIKKVIRAQLKYYARKYYYIRLKYESKIGFSTFVESVNL